MTTILNKKILLSLGMIAFVAVAAIGATGAFFSDTETSTGNTFTAGAIDLKVSNQSYYNGVAMSNLSWSSKDLESGNLFFNFADLKPGDLGEDTIDLTVNNNDAYACMDISVTGTPENGQSEPEALVDSTTGDQEGELQDELHMTFWADDGDNVLEASEVDDVFVDNQTIQQISDDGTVTLADSTDNVWTGTGPMAGATTYYIGKVFCFGNLTQNPIANGEGDPTTNSGFLCDGAQVTNASQTDGVLGNVSFTAVQSRNNGDFVCGQSQTPERTTLGLENKNIDAGWDPITGDGIYGTLTFISSHPTFDYTLNVFGLVPTTSYSLIYYADPWPGNNPGALIRTFTTDDGGDASVSGDVELGMDLPASGDTNYGTGAKIWVIKTSEYTPNSVNTWPVGAESLFENNLIIYNDTNN